MFRHLPLTAVFVALAPIAYAADNGVYLGAGVTQNDYGLDNVLDADRFDDEDSGFKLIAGFRPLDSFGVELSYVDHGDATLAAGDDCIPLIGVPCPGPIQVGAESIAGYAVGFLDFPLIDLFAKVGGANGSVAAGDFDIDESDFDFAWGAGAQAHFGSLGARLEYERIKVIEDDEIGTISLSFIYTFL
jgi:Outer membrane protein beta-barrel domain